VDVWSLGPVEKRLPSGRRRDVTNLPAIILDALQGVAYHDDKQVQFLAVWRVPKQRKRKRQRPS